MLTLKKLFLAGAIEYHWLIIKLIKKRCKKIKNEFKISRLVYLQNYHKFKAENLSIIYEILAGIRDKNGWYFHS